MDELQSKSIPLYWVRWDKKGAFDMVRYQFMVDAVKKRSYFRFKPFFSGGDTSKYPFREKVSDDKSKTGMDAVIKICYDEPLEGKNLTREVVHYGTKTSGEVDD